MSKTQMTRVAIENYKCHRKINAEIKPLTILTGSNAAGKSSFLQAMLLGLSTINEMTHVFLESKKDRENSPKESFIKISKNKKRIRTDNVFGLDLGNPSNIATDNSSMDVKINIFFDSSPNEILFFVPDDENALYFDVSSSRTIDDSLPHVFFLGAERQGPRFVSPIRNVRPYSVGLHGEDTAYLIADLDKRQRLEGLALPEALGKDETAIFRASCEAWLNMILPNTALECSIDIERRQATIKFRNAGGEFRLPTDTGFGITYVTPVIAQALAASLLENSILIIENPEAHLHPYSQSMLGRFLALVAENGVQVILETHSDHIIDGCRIQALDAQKCDQVKILFFEKKEDGSNCHEISLNLNGELESWPKGFFDQMKVDLKTLMEKRRSMR